MDNPFADPSVLEAQRAASQAPLDEDNPFAEEIEPAPASVSVAPSKVTGEMTSIPISPSPSAAPPNPISNLPGHAELLKRQQELEQKEKELERRERQMQSGMTNQQPNNWPPLPSWFPVKPCFYHDISLEIPLDFQKTVRYLYYLWMSYVLCLFINVIGNMTFWISKSKSEDGVGQAPKNFGLSIVWLVLYSPCSMCWYIPAYRAFKTDSSFNFFIFFFTFFFQICWLLLMVIGIKGLGFCGWIVSIEAISISIAPGIISMIASVSFTVVLVFGLIMLRQVHKIYRATGATFSKAMNEGQSTIGHGLWSNETVRNAAQSAATNAASHAAQNAFSPTR